MSPAEVLASLSGSESPPSSSVYTVWYVDGAGCMELGQLLYNCHMTVR